MPTTRTLRTFFLLSFLSFFAGLPRPISAAPPCFVVESGRSIGGIRLGMSLPELQKHAALYRLPLRLEDPSYPYVYLAGAYRIVLKQANPPVISYLSLLLPKPTHACLSIDQRSIQPTDSWLSLASQIGTCNPVEHRTGGSVIFCADQGLLLSKSRESGYTLSVQPPPSASANVPRCGGYIQRGFAVFTPQATILADASRPTTFSLQAQTTYCMDRLLLRTDTTPREIPPMGECQTIQRRGGTLVFCNHSGITFFFAGPHAKLERIELYHQTRLPLSTSYPPPLR